jgi:hypothetical protein
MPYDYCFSLKFYPLVFASIDDFCLIYFWRATLVIIYYVLATELDTCMITTRSLTSVYWKKQTRKQMHDSQRGKCNKDSKRVAQKRSEWILSRQGGQGEPPRKGNFWSKCLQLEMRVQSCPIHYGDMKSELLWIWDIPTAWIFFNSQYSSGFSNFSISIHRKKYILHWGVCVCVYTFT